MTERKWTSGPWTISMQGGQGDTDLKAITGPSITTRRGKKVSYHVAQYVLPKNANLIAAAPDLYGALERVAVELADPLVDAGLYHVVNAALAKARGETA